MQLTYVSKIWSAMAKKKICGLIAFQDLLDVHKYTHTHTHTHIYRAVAQKPAEFKNKAVFGGCHFTS